MIVSRPLISLVTICKNERQKIVQTCESVIAQNFQDFEWIVIDGKSNDGTLELLERYQSHFHTFLSEIDHGIYEAQNKGWQLASGTYVLFLNGGDQLSSPSTLSNFVKTIPSHGIIYGDLFLEGANGEIQYCKAPEELSIFHLLRSTIWHPSTFIRREILERFGGFDPRFKIVADYDFFLRAFVSGEVIFEYLPEPVAIFNDQGVSSQEKNQVALHSERQESQRLHVAWYLSFFYMSLSDRKVRGGDSFLLRWARKIPLLKSLFAWLIVRSRKSPKNLQ